MAQKYTQIIAEYPQIIEQKNLAELTTFNIGGNADLYFELSNIQDLPKIIEKADQLQIPYLILGGGSNILFSENGFKGLIIKITANTIEVKDNTIIADAGALLSQIIQTAHKNNLSGMEKMTGLPGTIGGAVRGNAGAFGTETMDIFQKALIYNQENNIHEVEKDYFEFDYRSSKVKTNKDIVLQVHLKLKKSDPEKISKLQNETLEIIKSRRGKQPTGQTSGSFFKNPNRDLSAGYLLDQAGCKGLQVGQAQVSLQHANWIINLGGATQKDIIELANLMRERVQEKFDVTLEPEVQFVGSDGFMKL